MDTNYDWLCVRLLSVLDGDFLPLPRWDDPERNAERVTLAVCELTGMTPERWDSLPYAAREPWLEKAIALFGKPPADPEPDIPLLDRVLAVLTPNQSRILTYLWKKKTASYENLRTVPGAWQDVPSDEGITAALKKIRTRLDENNLSIIDLSISAAKERVNLTRPDD